MVFPTSKIAAIFHGSRGSENSFWIPWLKTKLQENGYEVWSPSLTDEDNAPLLDQWTKIITETAPQREFDLMVGHSSGSALILRLLSQDFITRKAIMVAGYMKPSGNEDISGLDFNPERVKKNARSLTFIHSDNDPWECDALNQGEPMRTTFGGTLITITGEGHFGSDTYNQPYKKFPLLQALCLLNDQE